MTIEARQPLTIETRDAALANFTSFLDSLDEEWAQALCETWQTKAIPVLRSYATPPGTLTFEVTAKDREVDPGIATYLGESWQPTEDWVNDQEGILTIRYVRFHKRDEECIYPTTWRARAKKLGNCCGLGAAKALVRQQHLIPKKLRKTEFVFMGAVATHFQADINKVRIRVPIVAYGGHSWWLSWGYLDCGDFYRKSRSVHSYP